MKIAYLLIALLITACSTQPINTELSGGSSVGLGYGITQNPPLR